MVVEKVVSFDDGYGDNKSYDGVEALVIPSFATRWQPLPEVELANASDVVDPYSHITVEYDGYRFLVGEGARRADKQGDWIGEENKHNSELFVPIFKAQLALLARNTMDREVSFNPLVMGLSVKHDTPARRKVLADLIKGTHEVKVTLADGTVIDKQIKVEALIILKQPFGSFARVALDEKGQFKDDLVKSQNTLVVDLGARTLNLLTLQGFSVLDALSDTNNLGMYSVWADIQADIKYQYGKNIPIARIPLACEDGFISNGDDIRQIRDSNYMLHADKVASFVAKLFIDNKDELDRIILTGGGSEILRDNLLRGFKKRFPKAVIETMDRTATVIGYYNFGVRSQRSANANKPVGKKDQKAD